MSERVKRYRQKRVRPTGSLGDLRMVQYPDILVGHLDLYHITFKVVDLIVRDSHTLVRVHEHQALNSRGVHAMQGQHHHVALLAVRYISRGADRVPQVVIIVDNRGMGGRTARP